MVRDQLSAEADEGSGGMTTLVLFLTALWAVVGFFVYRYMQQEKAESQAQVQASREDKQEKQEKPKKKRGGMGRMGRGGNDVQEARAENTTAGIDDDEDEEGPVLSKKEQRAKEKQERKEELRQEREEAEQRKHDKQARRDEKYAARDAEREALEAQLAQEEAEREAERAKKAQEEFDEWKDMFETGDAGNEADLEAAEAQGKLGEFIEYIEAQKVVAMEDLAAHFDMRPQDVLKRIEDLLMMQRLSGVIDDRGKFIVITAEEMKDVVKFIRRRGRVNVTDLAAESNKLIDLTPKPLSSAVAGTSAEDDNKDASN